MQARLKQLFACVLAILVSPLCCGCEPEPRIPYISPVLANWPHDYHGLTGLKLHVFSTGRLHAREGQVLRGGGLLKRLDLPVLAFAIVHPREGLILFNTGMSADARSPTPRHPGPLALGAEFVPGERFRAQLTRAGLRPARVRWVILSSLRKQRAGQVKDFPNAQVVVSKTERDYLLEEPGGYSATDVDGVAHWKLIEFDGSRPLGTFPDHIDLFGDGSCLLVDARGATPGTMALLVRLQDRPVFLAGDLAAVGATVRHTARPATLYDVASWWDRIWRLKRLQDLVPSLVVVPGYDSSAALAAESVNIIVHSIDPPAVTPAATRTPGPLERFLPKPM